MTLQEIFDKVYAHLKKQGKPALGPGEYGPLCRYRTDDGLMCAAGCLIPDDLYDPEIEGTKFLDLNGSHYPNSAAMTRLIGKMGLDQDQVDLISKLQGCHDAYRGVAMGYIPETPFWDHVEPRLQSVAKQFGLTVPE